MRLADVLAHFVFGDDFPSFSEGLSLRHHLKHHHSPSPTTFPFLFGGTFIEAPVFTKWPTLHGVFPFLFGGTFIEASQAHENSSRELMAFPFLFGGTFIEAPHALELLGDVGISLPFRRDFH